MLKYSGVLVLPELDIVNDMVFDTIIKEKDTKYRTKEEDREPRKWVK